jgi:hypothetical protein
VGEWHSRLTCANTPGLPLALPVPLQHFSFPHSIITITVVRFQFLLVIMAENGDLKVVSVIDPVAVKTVVATTSGTESDNYW